MQDNSLQRKNPAEPKAQKRANLGSLKLAFGGANLLTIFLVISGEIDNFLTMGLDLLRLAACENYDKWSCLGDFGHQGMDEWNYFGAAWTRTKEAYDLESF